MERQVKMERDRLWSVAGQYLIRTDNCTVLYCTVLYCTVVLRFGGFK